MTAPDGTRLVCWDLAGPTPAGAPSVLLVHGSGLNGRSWAPVATELARAGFQPLGFDLRGHGASGRSPGGDYAWEFFASDLLSAVDQFSSRARAGLACLPGEEPRRRLAGAPGTARGTGRSAAAGMLAAGHSAGATALLLAEARRPGTFAAIWAWEPIMTVPAVPASDLRRARSTLAARARRRRSHFASFDEARAHFAGRGMFAEFAPEAFEGFLSGALVPAPDAGVHVAGERVSASGEPPASPPGGYRLACDPEDEARMYEASGPEDAWELLVGVSCPVRVLGGERSPAVLPAHVAAIAGRLPSGEAVVMPGLGHFGPFQAPLEVAGDLVAWARSARPAGCA